MVSFLQTKSNNPLVAIRRCAPWPQQSNGLLHQRDLTGVVNPVFTQKSSNVFVSDLPSHRASPEGFHSMLRNLLTWIVSTDTALALHTRYQRLRVDHLTIGLHTLIDIPILRCERTKAHGCSFVSIDTHLHRDEPCSVESTYRGSNLWY